MTYWDKDTIKLAQSLKGKLTIDHSNGQQYMSGGYDPTELQELG